MRLEGDKSGTVGGSMSGSCFVDSGDEVLVVGGGWVNTQEQVRVEKKIERMEVDKGRRKDDRAEQVPRRY